MATAGGQALGVLEYICYKRLELDEDALERILLDSRVRNSKIMVVSVDGCDRVGNSFLLNVFLKYLKNLGKPDWMDNPDAPLEGFAWNGSCERTTYGFLLWSEPFFITTSFGEEVCVLLMDTQGHYEMTWKPEPDKILALNSLLTSVQLFSPLFWNNFEKQFKYVVDYGRLALRVYKAKPCQTLYILARNGVRPYGFLSAECIQMMELKINSLHCFKDIHCFAMTHPGKHVQSENFHGRMSDEGINPEFKTCLKILTEHLFDPKNIVIKEINGKQVTGREFFHYFKSYCKVFQGKSLEPSSWKEATEEAMKMIHESVCSPESWGSMEKSTEEAWNVIAVDKAEDFYKREMNRVMYDVLPPSSKILDKYHNRCYLSAMRKLRRMGIKNQILEDELKDRVLELYENYKKDFECFETDIKSCPLRSAHMNGRTVVSESKKSQ